MATCYLEAPPRTQSTVPFAELQIVRTLDLCWRQLNVRHTCLSSTYLKDG